VTAAGAGHGRRQQPITHWKKGAHVASVAHGPDADSVQVEAAPFISSPARHCWQVAEGAVPFGIPFEHALVHAEAQVAPEVQPHATSS
jgi:hypothetical protein